jgi:hypothetical protein
VDYTKLDKVVAEHLEDTGNMVSGLILDDIGVDGHEIANLLWRIAAHLRKRNE